MKKRIGKYFNIYIVTAFIAGFSLLYMLSYAFLLNDINSGSSLKMKQKMLQKESRH